MKGGISKRPIEGRGQPCYALVGEYSGGLPARRCHRKNARVEYAYQEHRAPLCGQHARMLDRWIDGRGGASLDFAITMLVRWSRR